MSLSPVQLQEIYQLIAADVALQQHLEKITDAQAAAQVIVAAAALQNTQIDAGALAGYLQALARATLSDEALDVVTGGSAAPAEYSDASSWLPVFKSIASSVISDVRLKTDIRPLGRNDQGVALYAWRYIGGQREFTGALAQDLLRNPAHAAAVHQTEKGWLAVNYAALGMLVSDAAAMHAEGWAAWAQAGSLPSKRSECADSLRVA